MDDPFSPNPFGPAYPVARQQSDPAYREFFRAKLTAKTLVSGKYLYDWTEQTFDPADGSNVDANPARSGSYSGGTATSPALEVNNAAIDVTSAVYVWMRQKGFVGGQPYYEFEYAASSVSAWKAPVRVATTVAGTLSSSFENGDTVDGVTLATGDRILVKNQSSATENGIYTVNASGSPTRATDADTGGELLGAVVYVSEGTVNADSIWECTANATITIGATNLPWVRVGPGVQVEEADGNPSYTGATTLRFDQSDGFIVSNPATGVAQIDIAAATASQAGVVSTTSQTFAGNKTFTGLVDASVVKSDLYGQSDIAGKIYMTNNNGSAAVPSGCGGWITAGIGGLNVAYLLMDSTSTSNVGVRLGHPDYQCAYMIYHVASTTLRRGVTTTCTVKVGGVDKTMTITGGIVTDIS